MHWKIIQFVFFDFLLKKWRCAMVDSYKIDIEGKIEWPSYLLGERRYQIMIGNY